MNMLLKNASDLTAWCTDPANHKSLKSFVRVLILRLNSCFSKRFTSLRLRREKMWQAYHRLRTAQTFRTHWATFIAESISQPAFYQYVTHTIFKDLIEREFFVPPEEEEHQNRPLSFMEHKALRYVAGYICRKLRNNLESSLEPFKDEMIDCIMHSAGDEAGEDAETELWLNAIDRGGLWHVNDTTYSLFVIIEQQSRQFFSMKSHHSHEGQINHVICTLMNDNDVLFQWCLLSATIENHVAKTLFEKLVWLYVTVRGFAFAKSWLEIFKQSNKTHLQKKKALRREIHS